MTINQLCCPALIALVVTVLVYFAWSLYAIAKQSDQAMEEIAALRAQTLEEPERNVTNGIQNT